LTFVDEIGGQVVYAVDVVEVHYLVVVQQLLLEELEPQTVCAILGELSVRELYVPFTFAAVDFGIHGFNRNYDWEAVFLGGK